MKMLKKSLSAITLIIALGALIIYSFIWNKTNTNTIVSVPSNNNSLSSQQPLDLNSPHQDKQIIDGSSKERINKSVSTEQPNKPEENTK